MNEDERTTDDPSGKNGGENRASSDRGLKEGAPKSFAPHERSSPEEGNRAERRARRADGAFDQDAFLALAGRFIDQANRANRKVDARNVQMAMIWAVGRYSAHVAKNVRGVEEHEPFVEDMLRHFAEALRQNIADPNL